MEVTVTEVILPEKYTSETLEQLYIEGSRRVNKKAKNAREHFSGFAAAYQVVTLIILVLHFFIHDGFVQTAYDVLVGDNVLVWLFAYFYLSRADKVFHFLCKLFGIYTDNPYYRKDFFKLLGFYIFAEILDKDHSISHDTISYTIEDDEGFFVEYSAVYAAHDGVNDFRWLDREADKIVSKNKR